MGADSKSILRWNREVWRAVTDNYVVTAHQRLQCLPQLSLSRRGTGKFQIDRKELNVRRNKIHAAPDFLANNRTKVTLFSLSRSMSTRPKQIGNRTILSGVIFPIIDRNARECCVSLRIQINKQSLVAFAPAVCGEVDRYCSFSNAALEIYARDNFGH